MINSATEGDRYKMLADAEHNLSQINLVLDKEPLTDEERKAVYVAIEVLARLEATEKNKGWWFRTKRRYQLYQMYLGY